MADIFQLTTGFSLWKRLENTGTEQQLVPLFLSYASGLARICSRCVGQVGLFICLQGKRGIAGLLALCCPSLMHVELVGFVVVLSATPLLPCRVTSTARLARHTSRKSWPAQMHGTRKEVLTAEHKVKKEDIVFVFHFVFACKN